MEPYPKDISSNQKFSVLVIDDQKNWRQLLVKLLQEQFAVTAVGSYDQALEEIYNQRPPFHVVVTDMRLVDEETGNEDGLKLLEYLNRRGDETKTILVTGYATISTARRALSHLAAYDYLEKHPSDGSKFDIKKFREIVHQAAIDAEKQRPDGGTISHPDILLLEPDPTWRKKLKEIISKNGYNIYAPDINDSLNAYLKNDERKYILILLGEDLLNESLLDALHHLHLNAKMIILTSQNIDPIFQAMRNYPVLSAFNVHPEKFNSIDFQGFLHSALAYGTVKHVSATVEELDNQSAESEFQIHTVISGKTYQIKLSIQDVPTTNTTPVWLLPQKDKKEKIQLHLHIHASQIKLNQSGDAEWDISSSKQHLRPRPFQFSITPQLPGPNNINIEIDQNHRWLGRITIRLNVN